MKVFINGMGNISPQKTWGDEIMLTPRDIQDGKLTCIEPEYTDYIDVRQIRRMSRIIKMGVASSSMAMKQAAVSLPDGIITATGYGCLEDTGTFLSKLITNQEQALNPTPFIQSTHNTIGSQIALLLQCQAYNQTYAHGAFSFESALLDAVLQLSETPARNLLVGGIDEITLPSHQIQRRFGVFKHDLTDGGLFDSSGEGTINGEGSAFFMLSGEKTSNAFACIRGMETLYKPNALTLGKAVTRFLSDQSVSPEEIDLVLLGKSGIASDDRALDRVAKDVFTTSSVGVFKHLCGEYPVASAFALWLAAEAIHDAAVPHFVLQKNAERPMRNVLIFNQYFGTHYSLILLSAC